MNVAHQPLSGGVRAS